MSDESGALNRWLMGRQHDFCVSVPCNWLVALSQEGWEAMFARYNDADGHASQWGLSGILLQVIGVEQPYWVLRPPARTDTCCNDRGECDGSCERAPTLRAER